MKGLFITRGIDQQVQLFVDPDADKEEVFRLLAKGFSIRISCIDNRGAMLHIEAPKALQVIRPRSALQGAVATRLAQRPGFKQLSA